MRIITYYLNSTRKLHALTADEFKARFPDIETFNYDEFVWQEQPSKAAALARHDRAFIAWRNDIDAGRPPQEYY
jgi:hypothetical protein